MSRTPENMLQGQTRSSKAFVQNQKLKMTQSKSNADDDPVKTHSY